MIRNLIMMKSLDTTGIKFIGGVEVGYQHTNITEVVSLTALTGGLDTSPSEGDIVIIFTTMAFTPGTYQYATPTGFTASTTLSTGPDTDLAHAQTFYKIMTATPDTSVSLVGSIGHDLLNGTIIVSVWRGVDSATPFDVASTTITGLNSTIPNPASITPVTNGALVITHGFAGDDASAGNTYTSAAAETFQTVNSTDTQYVSIAGVGSYAWTSGALDVPIFGYTGVSQATAGWGCISYALRPAS